MLWRQPLPRYGSDHVPLLLECETELFKGFFKFERSWFQQEDFIQRMEVACTVVKRRIGEAFWVHLQQMRKCFRGGVQMRIERLGEQRKNCWPVWISWSFSRKRGNWSKRSGSALITDFTGVPLPSRESCRQVLEKRICHKRDGDWPATRQEFDHGVRFPFPKKRPVTDLYSTT